MALLFAHAVASVVRETTIKFTFARLCAFVCPRGAIKRSLDCQGMLDSPPVVGDCQYHPIANTRSFMQEGVTIRSTPDAPHKLGVES